ncbi:MAG: peptide ABC transporter ATP-binding protein, partial [Candidatus Bathyarchaeia archaeon]
VLVLYRGIVVESGTITEVIEKPLHPYTSYLKKSVEAIKKVNISDELTSRESKNRITSQGCPFATKCWLALDKCTVELPPEIFKSGRIIRCWLYV